MEDLYYKQIKEELINNEVYSKVKDYSKNKHDLETRYNIGKLIIEAQGGVERAKYGNRLIKEYSKMLEKELSKKYSATYLKYTRQFFLFIQKGQPIADQLTWSHYIELLPLKDINKINYYIYITIKNNLSRNVLREKIKSKEYERLPEETKLKLINNETPTLPDSIKEPIIINNPNNIDVTKEKVLQLLILENIDNFLKELGDGFSYIGHEYPIKIGNNYHYIDILLFNIIYNSYVIIELKISNFKAEYIGQVLKYVNYIDKNVKLHVHNKTIGIILVKENNRLVMEYTTDSRILVKEYIIK